MERYKIQMDSQRLFAIPFPKTHENLNNSLINCFHLDNFVLYRSSDKLVGGTCDGVEIAYQRMATLFLLSSIGS